MTKYQGRLIEWHDEKGYGFIQGVSDSRHERIFLHIKSFKRAGPRPLQGCLLEYELGLDQHSRPQALNVSYLKANQKIAPTTTQPLSKSTIKWQAIHLLMLTYWVSLFVLSAFGKLPGFTLFIIMLINAYTYWIYYQDKQAALNNQFRISEQHLLLMSALGGWTAAWFAAKNFRHKTQKQPFKNQYYAAIVIHIILLIASITMMHFYGIL